MSEETESNTAPLAEQAAFNDDFVRQFRANGGQIPEGRLAGIPALLLHTVGAKSGEARTSPLYRFDFEGRPHVVGSFGGSPTSPAWAHNLRANPAAERERAWAALVREAPFAAEHQTKAERVIPLFELVRE